MDFSHLFVQVFVAIVCAGVANVLIPRQIPGKFLGLVAIGLVGVWVGEVGYQALRTGFGVDYSFLRWNLRGVPIVTSIIGSAIVLYVVTTVLQWTRYSR